MTPGIDRLIRLQQACRNSRELLDVNHRRFLEAISDLELTDEVIAWAMTMITDTGLTDEAVVAAWIRGQLQREGERERGNTLRS